MKKTLLQFGGGLVLFGLMALPGRAQWGWPPLGWQPPMVPGPNGTWQLAPYANHYGLCSVWRRNHPSKDGCDAKGPSFLEKLRARRQLPPWVQ